jgi:hypothetical protein
MNGDDFGDAQAMPSTRPAITMRDPTSRPLFSSTCDVILPQAINHER